MTSKERVLAAVDHKLADRTPITFDAEKEVYEALFNYFDISSKDALFDALNVDTWMILPGNFIYTESEESKTEKTTIWGHKTRAVAYSSGGIYDEIFYNPLAGKDDIRDIDSHVWPTIETLDFSHFCSEAAAHKDKAIIAAATWGAYFIAAYVRGMEDLFIDFALRKRYAHHLINTIAEKSLMFLDEMLTNYGEAIDIVYMADDYCSQQGPLFSPQTFEEFVIPYLARVVEKTHAHGKKFLLHCCPSTENSQYE